MSGFEAGSFLFFVWLAHQLFRWVLDVLGNLGSIVPLLQLAGWEEGLVVFHEGCALFRGLLLWNRDILSENILGLIEGVSLFCALRERLLLEFAGISQVFPPLQLFGPVVVVLDVGDFLTKEGVFARLAPLHGIC